ncbi:uncharacterized protein JCM15063_001364 [Sporobolomyces koalae]|uniref:uncharacterized protein n=1 Tax=Sporobolomyces koalae TaxID=500713 RepID=UPI003179920D
MSDPNPAPGEQSSHERAPTRRDSPGAASSTATPSTTSPTIYVYYGQRHVKARIDWEVPLEEVIRQLTASSQLQVTEPAALFALRVKDTGQLVTAQNLHPILRSGSSSGHKNVFTLCSSPTIEAVETIDKLASTSSEPAQVKLATFSLRTLIKDPDFLREFLDRNGLDVLEQVVSRVTGNTLAYALNVVSSLLELEPDIWTRLSPTLVHRLIEIVATQPLINISRPATTILVSLVEARTRTATGFLLVHPHLVLPDDQPLACPASRFLPSLVTHLPLLEPGSEDQRTSTQKKNKSGASPTAVDLESSQSSLRLLQALLEGLTTLEVQAAQGDRDETVPGMTIEEYRQALAQLGVYDRIQSILYDSSDSALVPLARTFSESYRASLASSYSIPLDSSSSIDLALFKRLEKVSQEIAGEEGEPVRDEHEHEHRDETCWRRYMGGQTDRPFEEIERFCKRRKVQGGRQALRDLVEWANHDLEGFRQTIKVNQTPATRRTATIPFVSFTISQLVASQYSLTPRAPFTNDQDKSQEATGRATEDLLVFDLRHVHRILLQFWFKLWNQSNSGIHRTSDNHVPQFEPEGEEWDRVTRLVDQEFERWTRAELEGTKTRSPSLSTTLKRLESEFTQLSYKQIVQRQMVEAERSIESNLSGSTLQTLRTKIRSECLEFVKEQRIRALSEGIWVSCGSQAVEIRQPRLVVTDAEDRQRYPEHTHDARRAFVRLSSNRKSLHWIEARTEQDKDAIEFEVRDKPGVEWFSKQGEKLELDSITRLNVSDPISKTPIVEPLATEMTTTTRTKPIARLKKRTPSISASTRLSTFLNSSIRSPPVAVERIDPFRAEPTLVQSINVSYSTRSDSGTISFSPLSSHGFSELYDALQFLLFETSSIDEPGGPKLDPETLTSSTTEYIDQLTEVGLKVKLLDLTGEGIQVIQGGDQLVWNVPSEEERFHYKEFI